MRKVGAAPPPPPSLLPRLAGRGGLFRQAAAGTLAVKWGSAGLRLRARAGAAGFIEAGKKSWEKYKPAHLVNH